ncbi:MAG: hypothetical protein FJX06_18365 [Alphaproteobacteria bacterium]|nr:hypothetical protein [Alphaproteobacteria bacterium]
MVEKDNEDRVMIMKGSSAGKSTELGRPTRPEPPAMTTAVVVSNYLVALADAPPVRAGQIVPNTPENAKALDGKSRPASEIDLGVAGLIRKD